MRPKNIKFVLLLVIAGFISNGFCQSNENKFLTEKGIQRERLTAKGYGERIPRQLTRTVKGDGFTFEQGTRLTESFINSLKDPKMKEAAYQLNRRTEFLVTGKNFK